jgi:hypothetical protein
MRKSGEKLEGIRDADRRPQTVAVHKSSRGQVLRFSASLIHRCRSFVGSINRPSDFESRLAYIVKHRHGQPTTRAGPPRPWKNVPPLRRCVAKFYISCNRAGAARRSQRCATRLRSSVEMKMRMLLICSVRCRADDQRRRLMTGPKQSFVDVEPAPENAKGDVFPLRLTPTFDLR